MRAVALVLLVGCGGNAFEVGIPYALDEAVEAGQVDTWQADKLTESGSTPDRFSVPDDVQTVYDTAPDVARLDVSAQDAVPDAVTATPPKPEAASGPCHLAAECPACNADAGSIPCCPVSGVCGCWDTRNVASGCR
jgi:hypothetical protein